MAKFELSNQRDRPHESRRNLLRYAGGLALLAACKPSGKRAAPKKKEAMNQDKLHSRMPCIFLPHGGGPWPWIESQQDWYVELSQYLRNIPGSLPRAPAAIVCISAHWEEKVPTLISSSQPTLLYDFSGFPPEAYEVQWKSPGASDLASEIAATLAEAEIRSALDDKRGFDHGTFVPLSLSYPEPQIPCLQLSLVRGLDPTQHLRIGRSLLALRDRGVLIVGSGMSYHNMSGFMQAMRGGPAPDTESRAFDNWLCESMALEASQRETKLVEWEKAPHARACHPREEHLLPLHVIAGAAGTDRASFPFRGPVLGAAVSAVHFG